MTRVRRTGLVAAMALAAASLSACAPYGDGYDESYGYGGGYGGYGGASYARPAPPYRGQDDRRDDRRVREDRRDRRPERDARAEPRRDRDRDRRREEDSRPRPASAPPAYREGRPEQTGNWGPQIGVENRN